jgi:hypothetical protein
LGLPTDFVAYTGRTMFTARSTCITTLPGAWPWRRWQHAV